MMPKVIGNDSLIARVNEVQGCMYRQSNELGRLNRAVKKYKDENAKLREICADMLTCINAYKARKSICWECEHHRDVDELRSACFLGSDARNLGIEVGE